MRPRQRSVLDARGYRSLVVSTLVSSVHRLSETPDNFTDVSQLRGLNPIKPDFFFVVRLTLTEP